MKKIISAACFLLFVTSFAYSQQVDIERIRVTHGPYLQNISDTSVTIFWTTNRPAIPSVIITEADGKKRIIQNAHDGLFDGGGTFHKVRISGLNPGAKYLYNLKSVQVLQFLHNRVYYGDTLVTKDITFTTPDSNSDKIKFTVINDVHEQPHKMASYLKNNASGQEFYIFNGDMVNFLHEEKQLYSGFIDTAVVYFASEKPFVYVRGNHETRGFMARNIKNYIDTPNGKYYYSFDYGPVHFTVLDCGEDKPDRSVAYSGLADFESYKIEELKWLKKEIETDAFRNAKYRIVLIHMPVLNKDKQGYGMEFLRQNFGPVLQKANVNLMLSAHTHRLNFYDSKKSGFDYPVLVNSHNSFIEVEVDQNGINAIVKDISGKILNSYLLQ